MWSRLPVQFWTACAVGVVSATSLAMTLVWPQWIEMLVGLAPDGGDGSDEWGVTLVLLALTVAMAALASHEWRKAPAARRT